MTCGAAGWDPVLQRAQVEDEVEVLELDGFISEHLRSLLYRLAFTSACIETWYITR